MIKELKNLRGAYKIFVLSLGLLFAICYLLFTKMALAQEIRSYTIMPPTVAQKLNPGQSAEGSLKVINGSDTDLTFTVSVKDFIVEDTLGTPKLLPSGTLSNKYSAASWIVVTPSIFRLKPKEEQNLNYYIQVPQNARAGGHYAAVVYMPNSGIQTNGTGAIVNTQVGSLFYITINGPILENSLVSKFSINLFQEYGPVKILTEIKNLGDLHINPQATITVSGLFVNQSQKLTSHNIFPGASRDFENALGQTWMIGRYKAVLIGSYGAKNNLPLVATTYFWVFPWRVSLVVVLVVIALILIGLYLRKRKNERENNNETANEPKTENPINP
jgi:hypothetical protein